MTKQGGLTTTFVVDDSAGSPQDISNDINSFGISTPRGVQEVTGLDKSAIERILLMADGQVTISGTFNQATDMSHDVFSDASSTSVQRTVTIAIGQPNAAPTTGDAELEMEMIFANYELSRAANGEMTWSVTGQLANGAVPTWGTKSA